MDQQRGYDVLIVGGGPAGLAAAVTLSRSRRSVAVIDAGEPRNAPAAAAHNVFTREGMAPAELLTLARREAEGYGARFVTGRAAAAARSNRSGFEVRLDDGSVLSGRRLLLASGLVDELPDVPGVAEFWGRNVLHCPYCHGWEVRDQRIGVLGRGAASLHQVLLFRQLSDDVTLFVHEMEPPDDVQREQLAAMGVRVVAGKVARLTDDGAGVRGVVVGAREHRVDAVVVAPRFVARADLYEQLGGEPQPHPAGFGAMIPVDPAGRTPVEGVWAAGNASDLASMVIAAAASGTTVAAQLNADLAEDDARQAVERYRAAVQAP